MLIKRMLLVASMATGTMTSLALVDTATVHSLGVQGASTSADQLVALAKDVIDLSGTFNDNTDKLARSSAIRNLTTALGDTTLNGIGGSANFAVLFPHYTNDVANQFKILLASESTPEQQAEAYKLILVSQFLGIANTANGIAKTDSIKNDVSGSKRASDNAGILLHALTGNESEQSLIPNLIELGADQTFTTPWGGSMGDLLRSRGF